MESNINDIEMQSNQETDEEMVQIYKNLRKDSTKLTVDISKMDVKIYRESGVKTINPKGTRKEDNLKNKSKPMIQLIEEKKEEIERKKIKLAERTAHFNKRMADYVSEPDSDNFPSNKKSKLTDNERKNITRNNMLHAIEARNEKEDSDEVEYDTYVRSVLDDHPANRIPNYANYGDFRDPEVIAREKRNKNKN